MIAAEIFPGFGIFAPAKLDIRLCIFSMYAIAASTRNDCLYGQTFHGAEWGYLNLAVIRGSSSIGTGRPGK